VDRVFWDNTVGEWLWAAGVLLIAFLVVSALLRVVASYLRRLSRHTKTDVDDLIASLLQRTKGLLVFVGASWCGLQVLDLPDRAGTISNRVLGVAVLVQAGIWSVAILRYLLDRLTRDRFADDPGVITTMGAVRVIGTFVVWVIIVLTALATFGVNVAALVAGLGVGGIAVALAVQNILSDLFGALTIILDKPFQVGDFVVFGDSAGTVEHVGLRTTRIRALAGEQLVVANSDLLGSRIQNYKRMGERRVVFVLGVEYDTPTTTLREIPAIIRDCIESQEHARFDRAHLKTFADSAIEFESVYFMQVPDYGAMMDAQQEVNLRLHERFVAQDIGFAFPSRTLYLRDESDPPLGSRTPVVSSEL